MSSNNLKNKEKQKYEIILANTTDIVFIHDATGNIKFVNKICEQTYEYDFQEIITTNLYDIIDTKYIETVRSNIATILKKGGATSRYEILTYTKNRKRIWLDIINEISNDGTDNPEIISVARDITNRKKIEKELVETKRVIDDTAQYMPAIICETDQTLNITKINKEGSELFGLTSKDISAGVQILDYVHPDDKDELINDFMNIQKGDFGNFVEHRFIKPDGSVANLIINSAPILDDDKFLGIRSYVVDITKRRQAENKLLQSEMLFRSMFELSPIGICLFLSDGIIGDMNNSFKTMFGLTDIADNITVKFNLFEDIKELKSKITDLQKGKKITIETNTDIKFIESNYVLNVTRAGRRYLQWNFVLLADKLNPDVKFLAQVEDITERKLIEEKKLQEIREEADNAKKMLKNLRKEFEGRSSLNGIISRSEKMQGIFDLIPQIAQTTTSVLITGESGTGKELIAKSIHETGNRKDKPFIAINCGALPDNLLESELFGYKAGAFTDAKKDKLGKFAMANGGTIFLDEIGDISSAMQVKLLRVLQERVFEPLGATKSVSVDVHVLTATNKNLSEMVKKGEFRDDLYYRIKVLHIELPPLRERRSDIPLLCDHFIGIYNARFNKNIQEISSEALDILLGHDYPGNIRELENIIEYSFVFCKGSVIEPKHLPTELQQNNSKIQSDPFMGAETFDDVERLFIKKILNDVNGNKTLAAHKLGIHKATLFRKIKSLGI